MADDAATTPEDAGATGATEQQGDSTAETSEEHTSFMADAFKNAAGDSENSDDQPGEEEGEQDKGDPEQGDESQEDDSDAEEDGPPEQYEAFELPEGMPMNEAALERAMPMFKELGLNQENAQKAVTMHAELLQDMEQEQKAAVLTMRKDWRAELDKDPDHKTIGANATKAVDFFGDDILKKMFTDDWLGDHPSFVGCMAKIGAAMGEDNFVGGDGSPDSTKELPDRMFGDMFDK